MLFITFALVTLVLFGMFWGGSLVAQGYLYQSPADRLPLRAAISALLVGGFMTFWVAIDRKNPGKYEGFFSFAGETTRNFDEFEAVQWRYDPAAKGLKLDAQGNPAETIVKFKKAPGGKTPSFIEERTNKKFIMHDTGMMTAAINVQGEDGQPIRFNAELKRDERTGMANYLSNLNERRFVEEHGSRYIKARQLGVIYASSTGTVAVALLLNFLLFVAWMVAMWPTLKFSLGHALGFAAAGGLIVMLFIMPMLFSKNRGPATAPPAAEATPSPTEQGRLAEPRKRLADSPA